MLQNAAAGFAMPALAGLLSEQAVAGSPVGLPRVAPNLPVHVWWTFVD